MVNLYFDNWIQFLEPLLDLLWYSIILSQVDFESSFSKIIYMKILENLPYILILTENLFKFFFYALWLKK